MSWKVNPKLLNSLLTGTYAVAITGCVVCLIWLTKTLIFSYTPVLILTLLTPGVITSTVVYFGWDDWADYPKIKILSIEGDEEEDGDE